VGVVEDKAIIAPIQMGRREDLHLSQTTVEAVVDIIIIIKVGNIKNPKEREETRLIKTLNAEPMLLPKRNVF